MADPIRLQILKQLTLHLEGVSPANGFTADLSGAVSRGRQIHGENDPVPMLAILENPRVSDSIRTGEQSSERYDSISLLIQGWVKAGDEHPTDPAYQVAEDVEMRLGEVIATDRQGDPLIPDAYLLGRLIGSMTIGNYTVRPPSEQTNNKAFFYLTVEITLANE